MSHLKTDGYYHRDILELRGISSSSCDKNSRKSIRSNSDQEYLKQLELTLQKNGTTGDLVLRSVKLLVTRLMISFLETRSPPLSGQLWSISRREKISGQLLIDMFGLTQDMIDRIGEDNVSVDVGDDCDEMD